MVDLLEKKLGDLVRELESQRDALRRDLDKVNSQLELLAGLVKGTPSASSGSTRKASATDKSAAPSTGKRGRGRPRKSASVASAKSSGSVTSTKSTVKKKRGRPAKAASKGVPSTPKPKLKTKPTGGTLREELLSIAKSNNGTFSIREASKALVKSGRYDTAERAAANVHAAIKYYTSNFFKEGSQRGVYRAKA